jgi:hypothetical protein
MVAAVQWAERMKKSGRRNRTVKFASTMRTLIMLMIVVAPGLIRAAMMSEIQTLPLAPDVWPGVIFLLRCRAQQEHRIPEQNQKLANTLQLKRKKGKNEPLC